MIRSNFWNWPRTVALAALAWIANTNSASAQLIQSFNGSGTGYTIGDYVGGNSTTVNSNGPAGNSTYLRMTNATNDQNHALYFNTVGTGPFASITGSFDARIFNGTNPAADGFGFLLLPTATYGTSGVPATLPTSLGAVAWERPIQGGTNPINPSFAGVIAWSANIYNGNQISQTAAYFNNAVVSPQANTPGGYNLYAGQGGTDGGTAFDRFTFSFDLVNRSFSLSVNPDITGAAVPIYTNLALPAGVTPGEYRLALAGRTGGLNQILDVTNFNVTFTPVPEPTSMALMGVAAAAGLVIRRRSKGKVA